MSSNYIEGDNLYIMKDTHLNDTTMHGIICLNKGFSYGTVTDMTNIKNPTSGQLFIVVGE
jgi:hypothetical protein